MRASVLASPPVRTSARFPDVPAKAGHYESFYLKLTAPEGGRSAWIRHTVHKRPGEPGVGSVWFTWFDSAAAGPVATKQNFGTAEIDAPAHAFIRVGESVLSPGRAIGAARSQALTAAWDLRFDEGAEAFRHLPRNFLYRAPLPRTKLLSPYPNSAWNGTITIAGEQIDISGWRGMIGHNWGSEHAERWIWMQAAGFEGRGGGDYFDMGAGRIKIAGRTTPWIANANLVLDGEQHRLGGIERVRSTEIDERPGRCAFELRGSDIRVRGLAEAPLAQTVAWIYADPKGPEHHSLNCSISRLQLDVSRHQGPEERIVIEAGAAYELGMRDIDHGVPVQPYADG